MIPQFAAKWLGLGDEKAQRLESYRDNYMERNSVATFRSGLPDSMRLSDARPRRTGPPGKVAMSFPKLPDVA